MERVGFLPVPRVVQARIRPEAQGQLAGPDREKALAQMALARGAGLLAQGREPAVKIGRGLAVGRQVGRRAGWRLRAFAAR